MSKEGCSVQVLTKPNQYTQRYIRRRRKLPLFCFLFLIRPWAHGGNPYSSPLGFCRFLEIIFCTGLYLFTLSAKCISCGPGECKPTVGENAAQRPSCPGNLESSGHICRWSIFFLLKYLYLKHKINTRKILNDVEKELIDTLLRIYSHNICLCPTRMLTCRSPSEYTGPSWPDES